MFKVQVLQVHLLLHYCH